MCASRWSNPLRHDIAGGLNPMDDAVLTDDPLGPSGVAPERAEAAESDGGATPSSKLNLAATLLAALVVPVLYLLYLAHFAVSAPFLDDWFSIPVVHAALHGHLSWSILWAQYNDSRIVVGRVVLVIFGFADHLDLRAVIFFDGGLLIAAYGIVLALYRRYIGKPLTPIPVVLIGVAWFSLVDVGNSLWAFQVSWYLVPFFLTVMLYALLMPRHHHRFWLVIGVLAALGASLSSIQGFILWPLGVICIFWREGVGRRKATEIATWIALGAMTTGIYSRGFNFQLGSCVNYGVYGRFFSSSLVLHHPLRAAHYFLVLIGNVVPGGPGGLVAPPQNLIHELIGAGVLAASLFIIVQSWRHRSSGEPLPLPLLLICFGLVNDVFIVLGRFLGWYFGTTSSIAGSLASRYVLPNVIILTGIVIYGLARVGRLRAAQALPPRAVWSTRIALVGLGVFFVVQVVAATGYGMTDGALNRESFVGSAKLIVDIDRYPAAARPCELSYVLARIWSPAGAAQVLDPKIKEAAEDHLTVFQPAQYRAYRALATPTIAAPCVPAAPAG